MIKINKQLKRPDTGPLASGSILAYKIATVEGKQKINYFLTLYYNQAAYDSDPRPPAVTGIDDFIFTQVKNCTDAEWAQLNDDAGSGLLIETWLKEIIEAIIGVGTCELIAS